MIHALCPKGEVYGFSILLYAGICLMVLKTHCYSSCAYSMHTFLNRPTMQQEWWTWCLIQHTNPLFPPTVIHLSLHTQVQLVVLMIVNILIDKNSSLPVARRAKAICLSWGWLCPYGINIIRLFLNVIAMSGKLLDKVNTGNSVRNIAIGLISYDA
jgi:hypothetical protein